MGEVIRANRSTVVTTRHGLRVAVVAGQPYDADSELVRDFPHLFGPVVEQATANPGEVRNVVRPS